MQTGSNFGTDQRHDNPFLCDIGSGTMVSDGLTMINAQMSSTSFKLGKVKIGDHNYLGNNIHYPADGKTGANCLLGTKVMIPIDGPVRENVGLLGSPCFEIPRAVERDKNFIRAGRRRPGSSGSRKKNALQHRHHGGVPAGQLAVLLRSSLLVALRRRAATIQLHGFALAVRRSARSPSLFAILWFALLERASLGFRRLQPKVVSIYDEYFWFHERHWKFCGSPLQSLFKGTPFKNVISRLLGVKVGRKVFDDGCQLLREDADRDRRLREPERRLRHSGPLARGGRVQVRLHQDRQRLLASAAPPSCTTA